METDNEVEVWHAMRATYRRELDAVYLLEKENLGCFVPMQYKVSIRKGKKVRTLVPVIRNLVLDRKSTRLNSSHWNKSRMPSSA